MIRRVKCILGLHGPWEFFEGPKTGRLMRKCKCCGHVQMWRSSQTTLYEEVLEHGGYWVSRMPSCNL